ncbi:hypothetical protein HJG60_011478 [Phyllostomus discolor]|uniref:Uncharacterized protein n=1 Tax=Phyllostomus discolor TaxID=89673 RepID=A0A834E0U7_9CHIR|nr:hypothetical protein HJG60_011478 [Phyllostomus discolor]
METNENELTTVQNLWTTSKAVLRGKFIAMQAYLKKIETFQIINLILHLQELEEQKQTKARTSRRKKIVKIRTELNDMKTKRTTQKINKSRSWIFEKIYQIDKPLTRVIKKKRERTQINKVRNERGEITTDTTKIQRIVRNYYKQLHVRKFEDVGEMHTFLDKDVHSSHFYST